MSDTLLDRAAGDADGEWGHRTAQQLAGIAHIISNGERANPDEPFWYEAGPMSHLPAFNFPRFIQVADILRKAGYNIVSPAEVDDSETELEKNALASIDGIHDDSTFSGVTWSDFLSRDLIICVLPTCQGAILLEDWHLSRGARLETFVLSRLGKTLYEYFDNENGGQGFRLLEVHRDARLLELGVDPLDEETTP